MAQASSLEEGGYPDAVGFVEGKGGVKESKESSVKVYVPHYETPYADGVDDVVYESLVEAKAAYPDREWRRAGDTWVGEDPFDRCRVTIYQPKLKKVA